MRSCSFVRIELKQVGNCRPRAGESGPIVNEPKGGIEMSVKRSVIVVMAAVFVLGAGFAAAQTTTYEIRQGTVLNHYDNHLVVEMADGEVRDVCMWDDKTFMDTAAVGS